MPPQGPSPFVYLFPALLLVAAALYFGYGVLDRAALDTKTAAAVVTGKQVAKGSTTYHTVVIGSQQLVQGDQNPDAYILTFDIERQHTGGAVSRELYESLQPGDNVQVRFRRTRFSHRVVIANVSR
jgi:hypothetical protein